MSISNQSMVNRIINYDSNDIVFAIAIYGNFRGLNNNQGGAVNMSW